MSVEVIIPWFPNLQDELRTQSFNWVRQRYLDSGLPVRVAVSRSKRFCKADAVLPALVDSRASTVILADADVWCDGLARAIEAVRYDCEPWAKPHKMLYRLNRKASQDYMNGERDINKMPYIQRPYIGITGGGLVVLPRKAALEVPFDNRFVGWGGEDISWGMALHTLIGPPWLGQADLFHLFHDPQPRLNRKIGSEANEQLRKRYLAVAGKPRGMRRLIEEINGSQSTVE